MHHPSKKQVYGGIGLAVLATLIWSGNYVIARSIAHQLPPVSLAFYRWGVASVCLVPFALRAFRRELPSILAHKAYFFWTALCGVTIFNTLIYMAGHYTEAINLALIGTTSAPVFATILAALFLKEHVGYLRVAGMCACIAGILYLISKGSIRALSGFSFGTGELMIIGSAFSFAVYNTLVRKKPAAISPLVFLWVVFALGTVCLLPFYVYERMHSAPVQWHGSMWAVIIYLGIGNSIISFLCWNASIDRLGASGTALFANLIPVFSTIEAILFIGEEFTPVHMVSGLLIIIGLVVANLRKPRLTARREQLVPSRKPTLPPS